MEEYLSYAMLGLLSLFLIALIGGMLFGMMRGWKRTAKRTVVLTAFFIIALLMTPLISLALLKSPLATRLYDLVIDKLSNGDSSTVDNALNNMKDIKAFALGFPIVLLNIVVFWVLFWLFRYVLAPIFSAIFLKQIAPKKDTDGNKVARGNIWAGLGMGAVQGLVIFAFFFIPILGFMSTLNKIDQYEPKIAGRTVDFFNSNAKSSGDAGVVAAEEDAENGIRESMAESIEVLGDLNQGIRDINKSINSSAIGVITRFSGMQLLGDMGLGYFSRVKAGKTTVNVKKDAEVAFELTRDFVVMYDLVVDIDEPADLIPVFSSAADVKYMKNIVDKTFRLGLAKLMLNSEFGEFMRAEDMLKDQEMDFVEDQSAYRESIYDGVGNLSAKFMREDLTALIELLTLVFAEHQLNPTTKVCLYTDINNALLTVNEEEISARKKFTVDRKSFYDRQEALEYVFGNLDRTLTDIKITTGKGNNAVTRNLAEQILHVFGNMNVFKKLLLDKNNPELYSMPLAKALNMDVADARIDDFDQVMDGLANIVIRVVRVGPTIYKLSHEEDVTGFAAVLNENNGASIAALGQILEILTNRGDANGIYKSVDENGDEVELRVMGLGNILRKFIADAVTEQLKSDKEDSIISFDKVLGPLIAKLSPDGADIAWAAELQNIVDVVQELGGILSGDIDPDELVNALFKGDLLDKIAGSELLSDIILGVIDGAMSDMLDGSGVQFNFDGVTDSRDVVKAMGELVKVMTDAAEWMGDLDGGKFNDVGDIVDLFGTVQDTDGEDKSVIVMFAESGVKIEINTNEDGLITQADVNQYVNTLPPSDPLRKIVSMFVFK